VLRASDYLVVFRTEGIVRNLAPNFRRLDQLRGRGVIATAPGEDVDFVSRFFAPALGIDEDHVTGSAHCTLAPYWAERLGKPRLTALQVSPRGGELECQLQGERVLLTGHAVTYFEGEVSF
jgi:predicted PhzF superfamily epimerase YddE/YHI9